MASQIPNPFLRAPVRLFGKPREARQPGTPLQVTRGTSVWEVYNHEAEIVDRERIKDWNDSLNTLLIFAALYSAVLTAFIIESMKLLQEDNSDMTRKVLLVISRQLANSSTPAFEPGTFRAPTWAVRVNYEFFVSISCSLITALAAVLALQWVGSFDRALNQSSPEDRALQRQFRNEGVEKWMMEQIIGFLPAVIFFALFIFFIGLADWLWHVHHGVAAVVILGVIVGALFFWVTTLISIIDVRAPFRTPTSRSLPRYVGFIYQKASSLFSVLSRKKIFSLFQGSKAKVIKSKAVLSKWYQKQHNSLTTMSTRKIIRSAGDLKSLPSRWYHQAADSRIYRALRYIFVPLVSQEPFETRENAAIHSIETIKRSSLLWLAHSISVVPHQLNSFLILVEALLELPPEQLIDENVNNAPWKEIFTIICEDYFMKVDKGKESVEDIPFALHGMAFIGHDKCNTPEFKALFQRFWSGDHTLRRLYANLAWWRQLQPPAADQKYYANESLRHALIYAHKWPVPTTIATLLRIKASVRPLRFSSQDISSEVVTAFSMDVNALNYAQTVPLPVIDIVLDIFAATLSRKSLPSTDPVSTFLVMVHQNTDKLSSPKFFNAYAALLQQLCAALRQLGSTPQQMEEGSRLFHRILKLVESQLWPSTRRYNYSHLLLAMGYTKANIWSSDMEKQATKLLAISMPNQHKIEYRGREEWWINILVGFEEILRAKDGDVSHIRTAFFLNAKRALDAYPPDITAVTQDQIDRLQGIRDPYVRIMASRVLKSSQLALPLLPLDVHLGEDSLWCELVDFYCNGIGVIFREPHVGLLRELVLTVPGSYYDLRDTLRPILESQSNSLELLRAPVFSKILQSRYPGRFIDSLMTIYKHPWFIEEFMTADGPQRLPASLYRSINYLEETVRFIHAELRCSLTYGRIILWLTCLHGSLVSTGLSLQGREEAIPDKEMMQLQAAEEIHRFIGEINSLTQRWRHQREANTVSSVISVRPQPGDIDETQPLPGSEEEYPQIYQCDAKEWSAQEWEALRTKTDEVISGLRRGYIMPGPTSQYVRHPRDPEGLCTSYMG